MPCRRFLSIFGSVSAALGTVTVTYQYYGKNTLANTNEMNASSQTEKMKLSGTMTKEKAINVSRNLLQKVMVESKCPGMAVAVSVDGRSFWSEGFGLSDIENGVKFTPSTVAKIASISKPITMALVGKLLESGTLDIDADIRKYIQYWPEKFWNGHKAVISARQLASHFGGIRDYKKIQRDTVEGEQEFGYEEYYITEEYKSVKKSLGIFKDDPLINEPGTKHHYTNHGYTLLSAVIEGATGKKFKVLLDGLFKELDLQSTCVEDKSKLVYHRSREYAIGAEGAVVNAPFTVSSFKIAGAGLLSNVDDLVQFGNIMLYSRQYRDEPSSANQQAGYLKPSTVELLWTPIKSTFISWNSGGFYGLGWQVIPSDDGRTYVGHTGGTVGASSALVISLCEGTSRLPPKGIVVAVLGNMQGIGLGNVAVQIAQNFEQIR